MLCDDYNILAAGSGSAALEILKQEYGSVSAVLLDIVMPEMDGYAVLCAIRSNPLLAQLPVIMITASADAD